LKKTRGIGSGDGGDGRERYSPLLFREAILILEVPIRELDVAFRSTLVSGKDRHGALEYRGTRPEENFIKMEKMGRAGPISECAVFYPLRGEREREWGKKNSGKSHD